MIPKEILPPDLMNSAFISGGYAACPPLASDLDIWVYVNENTESMTAARTRILAWLESEMWPYAEEDSHTMCDYVVVARKVAVVRSPHWSHPVQIMVTTAGPAELLETFDISTHKVAIVFGNVIKGNGWTSITEPPRLLRAGHPASAARMEKIAARYGHSLAAQGTR